MSDLFPNEPEHPLLPLPTLEAVHRFLALGAPGEVQLQSLLEERRIRIAAANDDPIDPENGEIEPNKTTCPWLDVGFWEDIRSAVAEHTKIVMLLGGNRSTKSRVCGKLVVEALVRNPGVRILAVSEDEMASQQTQQAIVWHYLPKAWKAKRGKRDSEGVFYINYSTSNGFSERKLVTPNGSMLMFATYNQEPDQYEGMEWGHAVDWSIAWWADENLRLPWLNMFRRRGKFRPGSGLWSYTPIHGITPTIKECIGRSARTVRSRPAALLPADRVHVPGIPPGHMPYEQVPAIERSRVFYFHTELSPFGPGPNGSGKRYAESVAEDCADKPTRYIKQIAYGYTENVVGLAFPKFNGDVHVVSPENLPAVGTNYRFIDPAGDRNWFILWARVAPGNPRRIYVYRDWPDLARYGEWAVPTSRTVSPGMRRGLDGDTGPAQTGQGWGVTRYKQLLLAEERVLPVIGQEDGWVERDPFRARLLDEAMAGQGFTPRSEAELNGERYQPARWAPDDVVEFSRRNVEVREPIYASFIDPRAAANPQAGPRGGTNLIELFAAEERNPQTGEVEGPRMALLPAYSGKGIDDGIVHVNALLDYNEEQPVCPMINEPRLLFSEKAAQVIWMMENYTGRGMEDDGAKDPADLVRYLAQNDVRHLASGGKAAVTGCIDGTG